MTGAGLSPPPLILSLSLVAFPQHSWVNSNEACSGLDVSVPEFLRPKIARVKSTGAKRVMATRAESTQPQGYHQQQHYNTMPNLDSRAEIASAPAPRKKPPLEPLRALKPTPSSSEPFNLADLGPNSDPSNYTSMMVFPLKPSGGDTDSDDGKGRRC